ncbi:MAG: hypothetical protein LBK66_00470 [Spirochaetaceae bacterium]|jgi:hypothetical protein|nr:hypothetical protein [Spirochaetaceae bacterium]
MEENSMLLTVEGYFEAGRFIADSPVYIPEKKKTVVTVLDKNVAEAGELTAHKNLWKQIIKDLRNCDEVLEGMPERLRFRSPEETETL